MKMELVNKYEAINAYKKEQMIKEAGGFCSAGAIYLFSSDRTQVVRFGLRTGGIDILLTQDIDLSSSLYDHLRTDVRLVIDF